MSVIPDSVIDNWRSQYGDDSPLWTKYPEMRKEKSRLMSGIELDRRVVHQACFRDARPAEGRKPVCVATAGAPLAGKSTVIEQEIIANPERYGNVVKVDPDRWSMLFMVNTYHAQLMSAAAIADAPDFQVAQSRAYDIARPASNILSLEILNEAVEGRYDLAHGTTMTGPNIRDLLSDLKRQGYEIDLFLCGAEDDMRADAQQYRAHVQGYYQSTPEEVKSKGIAFPKKMKDYFDLADNLVVFWRGGVTENAIKAAVYTGGSKTVLNQDAYESFVNKYEADRFALSRPEGGESVFLPSFADVEQLYLSRLTRGAALGVDRGGNDPSPVL